MNKIFDFKQNKTKRNKMKKNFKIEMCVLQNNKRTK